ncbi:Protein of unknown function [Hymenobacter daecheongensis DSM 21074]|uniref:DUF2652 domain-containing protein n=1 Tax=Hymenobacter daecheongensis DSM 21074 TaxID=1121955 RepID=A0A1M6KTD2_9BACT|nr:DUF2652 domain-containing protein [Hymenobacter daecheongensis]SHJ62136.1 Protein of unknown function [Hymenobacter daecheongensis DSM 21074]
MLPSASLLLMPDISGFTTFVHETELEHSQHIISELLETLISANELNLTVAEIEGDAVLFYREESVPTPAQIVAQARRMFRAFHGWVQEFVSTCPCGCAACQSVRRLTLKVVAHAGPLGFTTVRQQRKPFGEAVVVLHRLLKNDIPSHEYVLLSHALLAHAPGSLAVLGTTAQPGISTYDDLGDVRYVHVSLRDAAGPFAPVWEGPAAVPLSSAPAALFLAGPAVAQRAGSPPRGSGGRLFSDHL